MDSQIGLFESPANATVSLSPDGAAPGDSERKEPVLKWSELLQSEMQAEYYQALKAFVKGERAKGRIIYPADDEVFSALSMTSFPNVRVVILGQDPYHGPNQAHGLCFSVKKGVPPPPSLLNIFQELQSDLSIGRPSHGCLDSWARQGVLLLNATLTVEAGRAGSHQGKGWETFTDKIVRLVNDKLEGVVFMLWGSYAQKKGEIIDRTKHHVLTAPHPSPLSAHRGFFGCRHFSKANKILRESGKGEINWALLP